MAAHNYWRVDVTANMGDGYLSVSNLEFRTTAGQTSQATGGTFGGTEPSWNTTISGTTTSGGATLTCISVLPNPLILGPKIPS